MEQYENEIVNVICHRLIPIHSHQKLIEKCPKYPYNGFIYLGRQEAIGPTLKERHITAIITIMDQRAYEKQKIKQKLSDLGLLENHVHIAAYDSRYTSIKEFFPIACDFFEKNLKQERNILIHCKRGVSRSPAMLSSFLMKRYKLSFEQCNKMLKQRRPVVSINKGFEGELRAYQLSLDLAKKSQEVQQ